VGELRRQAQHAERRGLHGTRRDERGRPHPLHGPVDVEDIELEFREGRVVDARAARGQEYLRATLATDAGASRLGEIGIGTNAGIDRPIGAILFDEKMGGTVHLAVGRSYPETGGVNQSAVHWDMICDLRGGGRLSADGEVVVDQDGFRL
jgi:aminopeptidase